MSTANRALRAVPWTLATNGVDKGMKLLTTLVLARLLVPEDFGLVALAVLVIGVAAQFKDLGVGNAMVVRKEIDERTKGTVLVLMMGLGVLIALALAALSPVVALAFDEPRVMPVLAVMAVGILVSGPAWFYISLLQREMAFRQRFRAQVVHTLTYSGVAIPLAVAGAGVWSLVGGQVLAFAAEAVALVIVSPYRVRPAFERRRAVEMIREGRGFLAQGGVAFLSQNADYLVVGRILGPAALGLYSMAYRLTEFSYTGIGDPVARVTFPTIARLRAEGEDVARPFVRGLRLLALASAPLGILLSATADPFTRALLGEGWIGMIGVLSVLGLWGALRPVSAQVAWLLNASGQPGLVAMIAMAQLAVLVPALVIAASAGGITAVAGVMVASLVIGWLAMTILAGRRAGVPARRHWRGLAPVIVAGTGCWLAARGTAVALEDVAALLTLVAACAAGLLVYLALMLVLDAPLLRDALSIPRRALGRPAPDRGLEPTPEGMA
jgi:O-antigen/teichoic acid export membrane protein